MAATNLLVAYEGLPSNEVRSIMRRVVAKNSTEKYNLENVKLLLWLYNAEDLRAVSYTHLTLPTTPFV